MRLRLLFSGLLILALPALASSQTQTPPTNPTETAADTTSAAKAESTRPEANAHVARAVFATEVVDKEPADELAAVPSDLDRLYFFTEIVDMEGDVITHEWSHEGEVMAEIPIEIGGPRWRVHSAKTLPGGEVGDWVVRVLDSSGKVLHESRIAAESGRSEAAEEETAAGSTQR